MKELIATAALLFMVPALALAQNVDHSYRGQGYFFFGMGTGMPSYYHPLILHVGGGGEGFLYKGLGFGAEAGYASWGRYYNKAWIASGDFSYHFRRHARRGGVDPFVLGGVSFVGPTMVGGGAWLTRRQLRRWRQPVAGEACRIAPRVSRHRRCHPILAILPLHLVSRRHDVQVGPGGAAHQSELVAWA